MKLISHRKLTLSDNETHREILVFQKYAKPKIKLPRRVGLAQNNPLIK
jgi:16S rRNA (guanine527-N7)-methyltransferase